MWLNELRVMDVVLIQQVVPPHLNEWPPAGSSVDFVKFYLALGGGVRRCQVADVTVDTDLPGPPSLPEAFRDFDIRIYGKALVAAGPVLSGQMVAVDVIAAAFENLSNWLDGQVYVSGIAQVQCHGEHARRVGLTSAH